MSAVGSHCSRLVHDQIALGDKRNLSSHGGTRQPNGNDDTPGLPYSALIIRKTKLKHPYIPTAHSPHHRSSQEIVVV